MQLNLEAGQAVHINPSHSAEVQKYKVHLHQERKSASSPTFNCASPGGKAIMINARRSGDA